MTSHFGARPDHAEWQGQIYSLSGKNPKYKDFYAATGYGTGEGLGGWNCRHSFYPYFEGLSLPAGTPDFSEAENLEMYNNQQQQRAYERAVRRSKRELAGIDAARSAASDPQLVQKLDKQFARKSVTLKNREERLSQFCKDKGLMPDNSRVRVVGFGKSEAQKAVWAARKKGLTSVGGSGTIISPTGQVLSTKVKQSKQNEHILGHKRWLEETRKEIKNGNNPKSFFYKNVDVQGLADKYIDPKALIPRKNSKYPIQYAESDDYIGKTYDKKAGKYVKTKRFAIDYSSKGIHLYPVFEK